MGPRVLRLELELGLGMGLKLGLRLEMGLGAMGLETGDRIDQFCVCSKSGTTLDLWHCL
ncbi:MAG: hypothetical protein ACYCOU_07990 [Sulfobacillus sp.]